MVESEEYLRIYRPNEDANNCCFLCRKAAGQCNWSADGTPVNGWKIRETAPRNRGKSIEPGTKILYCPEFVEGTILDVEHPDEDGLMKLFEKMVIDAANEFKNAYKRLLEAKFALKHGCSEWEEETLKKIIDKCLYYMEKAELLLGSNCETLKNRAEKELLEEKKEKGIDFTLDF